MEKQERKTEKVSKKTRISPSQVGPIMKVVWMANRVPYLHGPPGIGKSDILKQQATSMGFAYVDIRLATRNPSQIAGIPFPHEEHGTALVRYSIPVEFPRDLDVEAIVHVNHRKRLRFANLNPKGSNDIHYCTNPMVTAKALDESLTATIVEKSPDQFTVELHDADGKGAKGEVLYTIVGEARTVVCFDELSSANHSVQAVAYSLIWDRRLGEYVFPKHTYVVAAGNREEDRGVNHTIVQPLRNRFSHYELEINWTDWISHANLVHAYPAIVSFMQENEGKHLFKFDAASDDMAWPSPRTWMMLSDIEYEADTQEITDEKLRLAMVVGTVGTDPAWPYLNWRKQVTKDIPKASDILTGKLVGKMAKRLDTSGQTFVVGALINSLSNRLKEANMEAQGSTGAGKMESPRWQTFFKQADAALAFMVANFAPDIISGAIRRMSVTHRMPLHPKHMPSFKEFMSKTTDDIL